METKKLNSNEMLCQKMKEKLLNLCDYKYKFYKKNKVIYRENMPSDDIYYLREGKAKIFTTNSKHKEHITNFVSSGDFFGIKNVISGENHWDSCKTIDNTTLCAIPKKDFLKVVKKYSDIDYYLIQVLVKSSNETINTALSLYDKTEKERLANALLCLCNKFRTDTIKILKKDLSNFSNIERSKLKLHLSELKEKNLIHLNSERIKICDKNGLRKMASILI